MWLKHFIMLVDSMGQEIWKGSVGWLVSARDVQSIIWKDSKPAWASPGQPRRMSWKLHCLSWSILRSHVASLPLQTYPGSRVESMSVERLTQSCCKKSIGIRYYCSVLFSYSLSLFLGSPFPAYGTLMAYSHCPLPLSSPLPPIKKTRGVRHQPFPQVC